jgi:hypothetical protein
MTTFENRPVSKLGLKGMLQHLNDLYYPPDGTHLSQDGLARYYQALDDCRRQLRYAFPGLTIVLAEIHDRDYVPGMTHVLAPETANTEHRIGWHDTLLARLSLDDGQTTLSDVESCEVKQEDGSWLAGTVAAGGPASQSYILTTADGTQRVLKHGDTVRHIVFRDPRGQI